MNISTRAIVNQGDSEKDFRAEAALFFSEILTGSDLKSDGSLSDEALAHYNKWKDDEYVREQMDAALDLRRSIRLLESEQGGVGKSMAGHEGGVASAEAEAILSFAEMLTGPDLQPDGSLSDEALVHYNRWKDNESVREQMDGALDLRRSIQCLEEE